MATVSRTIHLALLVKVYCSLPAGLTHFAIGLPIEEYSLLYLIPAIPLV
jgi:hypothetical protein